MKPSGHDTIPIRCIHCSCLLPDWPPSVLLWGECGDCSDWQQQLSHRESPPPQERKGTTHPQTPCYAERLQQAAPDLLFFLKCFATRCEEPASAMFFDLYAMAQALLRRVGEPEEGSP